MTQFLDFRSIDGPKDSKADNFEMACAQLVEMEFPGATRVRPNPGDSGIDVLVGSIDDPQIVFQSKYFINGVGKSQREQASRSLRRLLQDGIYPRKWVLCIPVDLSVDEQVWLRQFGRRHSRRVECWGETKLLNLLCKYREIARVYFPRSVVDSQSATQQLPTAPPTELDDPTAAGWLYMFFDRPAFKDPFHKECSVADFDTAMQDTIAALNTGILRTREGQIIAHTKPRNHFTNESWKRELERVASILSGIRAAYADALRMGLIRDCCGSGLGIDPNDPNGAHLVHYMNERRDDVLDIMNGIFAELGKPPLAHVERAAHDGWIGYAAKHRFGD